ncbi:hypothetical protein DNHGIG_28350 [Collibacillus ludicampi]|uniref:DUF4440 domain-containing protein n=1 Tax=Collibacillus ludicampi TaxID=2771369 RepID=A0AAV4LHG6_9BACL|nr:nuclear transport factor 2 family protein [Collibacillus ludicampi]GIM47286.1 hypothetical protein DNHGIG_28350 [Collibacillus ludicampi]
MEDQSSFKEHLCQLEKQLLEPEIRTSPAELEKLLADDFFEFGISGNIWYKKDCIGEGRLSVREMTLYDFDIHPLSADVVLTTYRVTAPEITNKITASGIHTPIWKV